MTTVTQVLVPDQRVAAPAHRPWLGCCGRTRLEMLVSNRPERPLTGLTSSHIVSRRLATAYGSYQLIVA